VKILVPHSDTHPTTRVTIETRCGVIHATFDHRHREANVRLPDGVAENDVIVYAEFCGNDGKPDPRLKAIVLQERAAQPASTPVEGPKAELVAGEAQVDKRKIERQTDPPAEELKLEPALEPKTEQYPVRRKTLK
jgi:hypothetical protein